MKSERGNGLTRIFGVAATHKYANLLMLMRLLTRTMKETDDDESDDNRNELMTTMMRTKRMMRMMRMMRMLRMLRMRMTIKMRMLIMMSRAVAGLQNLCPASGNPQYSNRLSPSVVSKRYSISRKTPPKWKPESA